MASAVLALLSFPALPLDPMPFQVNMDPKSRPVPVEIVRPASEHEATIEHLERFADLMDRRFMLPGSRIGVGLDSILGFLPVVGDVATAGPGLYLLVRAHRMGIRKRTLLRMGKNLAIDLVVGAIPLFGDLFDIAFRSNVKNVELIKRDLRRQAAL